MVVELAPIEDARAHSLSPTHLRAHTLGINQEEERALTKNQIGQHLDLGLCSLQNWEREMTLLKPPACGA